MYDGQDGIEHFAYSQNYKSLYELCTAYRFKDIKTLINISAESTLELIHLVQKIVVQSVRKIF